MQRTLQVLSRIQNKLRVCFLFLRVYTSTDISVQDIHKLNSINGMKKYITNWEKIFAKDISDKQLLSKTYSKLLKHINTKTNYQIKK